jgi:agmatinase
MYNALHEIPQLQKLVQIGTRDYSLSEVEYIKNSNGRVKTFFDKEIKERQYEGESWKSVTDDIVAQLPAKVYVSFDIDGLDPKLCPNTGTPVQGGFETQQIYYLLRKIIESGRQFIGFDLNEVGVSTNEWDENVGARILFKLCNLLIASNNKYATV